MFDANHKNWFLSLKITLAIVFLNRVLFRVKECTYKQIAKMSFIEKLCEKVKILPSDNTALRV